MNFRQWIHTTVTALLLITITTLIYLYASGYRIIREPNDPSINIDFRKTGMINARSIPEGANVYVNGIFSTATNDNVPALDPGNYTLRITKNGYYPWEKEVKVYAELVTDITALLIPQSPRFEPLTTTGARVPVVSPTLSKLAYFSKDGKTSGLTIVPLTNAGLNIFRSSPDTVIEDTLTTIYSNGKNIEWSPDELELLVQGSNDLYYLVDLQTEVTQSTTSPETIRERWNNELVDIRNEIIQKITLPADIVEYALDSNTLWSPDQKKFLYIKTNNEDSSIIEHWVYNIERPLPIGEETNNLVFTTKANENTPFVSWFADSFHLVMVENFDEEMNTGKISIIRIDGSNKTTLYESSMYSPRAYSSPGGDKIIFLTSFTPAKQTDLYTIGLR